MTNSGPRSAGEVQSRRGVIVAAQCQGAVGRVRGDVVDICDSPRFFPE